MKNNSLGLLLAMALMSQSDENNLVSQLNELSNEESIKLAPEGTPEHTIFNSTGQNPFDLLDKIAALQENTPRPEDNAAAIKNIGILVDQMVEALTPKELAIVAIYSMLSID